MKITFSNFAKITQVLRFPNFMKITLVMEILKFHDNNPWRVSEFHHNQPSYENQTSYKIFDFHKNHPSFEKFEFQENTLVNKFSNLTKNTLVLGFRFHRNHPTYENFEFHENRHHGISGKRTLILPVKTGEIRNNWLIGGF